MTQPSNTVTLSLVCLCSFHFVSPHRCVNVVSMLCQCCVKVSYFIRDEVLQLMVEGGAVLQGQMLKEGLCEARLAWCSPCAPDL